MPKNRSISTHYRHHVSGNTVSMLYFANIWPVACPLFKLCVVKLDVPTPEALPYLTNVSQKKQTLVGYL